MNIQTQTLAPSTSIKREDVPPPVIVYPNGKTEIFDMSTLQEGVNYVKTIRLQPYLKRNVVSLGWVRAGSS